MKGLHNLLLLFFSLFLLLCAAETGYRLITSLAKPLYQPSSFPDLGWDFTPGALNANPGQAPSPHSYLINDRGFRDHTNGRWQGWTESDTRIAVIGDSVTAGADVGYEETYSAQLEELLRRQGIRAKVANLGLDATNTRQHFALMQAKALALGPSQIVLGYCLNDTEKRFWETLPAPVRSAMRHFHLGVFLSQRLAQTVRNRREAARQEALKKNKQAFAGPACSGYTRAVLSSYETKAWPETARWIARMAVLARRGGIDFRVVIFPFEEQLQGICPAEAQEKIKIFLKANRIPFLDLLEPLKRAGPEGLYLAGDSIHLNAEGHRIAAESILQWLEKNPVFSDMGTLVENGPVTR